MTPPVTVSAGRTAGCLLALLLGGQAGLFSQQPAKPAAASRATSRKNVSAKHEEPQKTSRAPVTAYLVGEAITVSGARVKPAVILVQEGKIKAIGRPGEVTIPPFAERINRPRQVAMPGFVHPASLAYLSTQRFSTSGRSLRGASSAKDRLLPTAREGELLGQSGFTTLCVLKGGGGVGGEGVLVRPLKKGVHHPGPKDVLVAEGALLCMGFAPSTSALGFFKQTLGKARRYVKELAAWKKHQKTTSGKKGKRSQKSPAPKKNTAKASQKKKKKGTSGQTPASRKGAKSKTPPKPTPKEPKRDKNLMPLVDLIQGRLGGILAMRDATAFLHFEEFFKEEPGFRPAIWFQGRGGGGRSSFFGRASRAGTAAWRVVDQLLKLKLPVVLSTALEERPRTSFLRPTQRRLLDAGIPVALVPESSSRAGYPGFRFQLMQLWRQGIPEGTLLRAVTLTPAEILGIQDRCGSLDPGKEADILFFSGDPLDPTSRLMSVLLGGVIIHEEGPSRS